MRKLKAFTLVELLVVVAIIAVLATVIVIGFAGQRQKAMNSTIKTNISESLSAAAACNAGAEHVTGASNNGTSPICKVSSAANATNSKDVTALWPVLSKTDKTWSFVSWADAVLTTGLPQTACTNASAAATGGVKVCALGGPDNGTALATATTATKAAVCDLASGCKYYSATDVTF